MLFLDSEKKKRPITLKHFTIYIVPGVSLQSACLAAYQCFLCTHVVLFWHHANQAHTGLTGCQFSSCITCGFAVLLMYSSQCRSIQPQEPVVYTYFLKPEVYGMKKELKKRRWKGDQKNSHARQKRQENH